MFLALFGLISSADNSALGILVGVLVHALIPGAEGLPQLRRCNLAATSKYKVVFSSTFQSMNYFVKPNSPGLRVQKTIIYHVVAGNFLLK